MCIRDRYCSYSLNHQDEYVIGHVNTGIDYDKVRPFESATFKLQSDEECINGKIARGCSSVSYTHLALFLTK